MSHGSSSPPMSRDPRGGDLVLAVAGCLVVAVASWLALRTAQPPQPRPASAAASEFSAERAMEHVRALATAPRPVGTAQHRRAADYVGEQLTALGLEVQVQETTWVRGFGPGRQTAARVRNVLGRLAGAEGADKLLLMAHYDSQPQTFGAGDDAAGIATILETLRALTGDPQPTNEIIVAITDAEEIGLIGADAFVAEHPWFDGVDRALNFEGRGQRGAALMFETAEGGLASARDLAGQAPFPAASSMSYEVYRRMPNDTDFSVVRRAGVHGLNFAFIGALPAYHSHLDTAERLDRGTLQHMGSNALAMVRYYARHDLSQPQNEEGVYFNPLGTHPLWVLGALATRGVALGTLLVALVVVVLAQRRQDLTTGAVLGAWALLPLGVVVAMVLTWLARQALGSPPATPYGVPYLDGLAASGLVLIAAGAWSLCLPLWSRRSEALSAALGLLWAIAGAAVAWWVPGVSHLFWVPALALAVGAAAVYLGASRWWLLVALPPAVLVWVPALHLSYQALTVRAAIVLAVPAALAATLTSPALASLGRRQLRVIAAAAALVGLVLAAWAIHGVGPSPDRPLVDSLFVYHERDGGTSTWFSLDSAVGPWSEQALGASPDRSPLPMALDPRQRELLSTVAALPPPPVTLSVEREVDERPGEGRRVAFRVRSSAASLRLWAHANVTLSEVSVDGRACELNEDGELRLSLHGIPADGFLVEVSMDDRWPLYIEIVEVSYGLPDAIEPRPGDRIPRPGWWTDTTMIHTEQIL